MLDCIILHYTILYYAVLYYTSKLHGTYLTAFDEINLSATSLSLPVDSTLLLLSYYTNLLSVWFWYNFIYLTISLILSGFIRYYVISYRIVLLSSICFLFIMLFKSLIDHDYFFTYHIVFLFIRFPFLLSNLSPISTSSMVHPRTTSLSNFDSVEGTYRLVIQMRLFWITWLHSTVR